MTTGIAAASASRSRSNGNSEMDNQRWWAGIIGAVRGGLWLFALYALLLVLFAGVVVVSNTSEQAKLWILAVVGVFLVGNTVLPLIILYGRPKQARSARGRIVRVSR